MRPTKAVVLCAGLATRMRPLTHGMAKHLLPVANKPVLLYALESLREVEIRDVAVVVSRETHEGISSALGSGERLGLRIRYLEQPRARGLADGLRCAREFVGRDRFVLFLGDTLIGDGLRALTDLFSREHLQAGLLLAEVTEPRRYGVAQVEGDRIVRLVEKPDRPPSNLAIVGAYCFDHHIFDAIDRLAPSWRDEYEITEAVQDLIDRGLAVRAHRLKGWWKDIGGPADLLEANRWLLARIAAEVRGSIDGRCSVAGQVAVGEGAVISNSVLVGPVIVGSAARIDGARIGPNVSIGDRVQVSSAEIGESIVMEGSAVRGVELHRSVIGRNVRLRLRGSATSQHRLEVVLGDDSLIEND
jgi:glucose-1-phosphate thymidylyltransferase